MSRNPERGDGLSMEELARHDGIELPARQLMEAIGLGVSADVSVTLSLPGLPGLPALPGLGLSVS